MYGGFGGRLKDEFAVRLGCGSQGAIQESRFLQYRPRRSILVQSTPGSSRGSLHIGDLVSVMFVVCRRATALFPGRRRLWFFIGAFSFRAHHSEHCRPAPVGGHFSSRRDALIVGLLIHRAWHRERMRKRTRPLLSERHRPRFREALFTYSSCIHLHHKRAKLPDKAEVCNPPMPSALAVRFACLLQPGLARHNPARALLRVFHHLDSGRLEYRRYSRAWRGKKPAQENAFRALTQPKHRFNLALWIFRPE
jgi:hypothetical protein